MKTKELIENEKKYLMQTYSRPAMVLDKGGEMKVWDLEGKQYYDFIGGIAVNALGYSHPKLVQAIKHQAEKLIHCSNLFYSEPQIILAQMLVEFSCGDKVFFGNSGAEVNEGAIKLAVKYFKEQNKDKHKIIYMKNSFHGRTIGALAATGQYKYQNDYLAILPKFKEVIFNDLDSVKAAVDEEVAAVLIEPIQGESGIKIATQEFIKGLRELCNKEGILLIFDEIQCGLGRTGKMFAYQHYGIEPDILTIAKSLGGGIPIGAFIAKDKIASSFKPGDHGTTFGGNPLACAAAIANLKILQEEDLIRKCQKKGEYFKDKLKGLKEKYPEKIEEVRGLGLMVGMELKEEGQDIVKKCLEEGVLINCAAKNVLRFLPPLIVEEKEIDYLIGILDKVFKDINLCF
ncbi:acetylornithine aminotransferase [Candidatus Atribacteria bacterium RBG_19FT_COMBO_35_14]|uniref:Acetylornithine aminotransferase n=1 Tax=Candidatus Sediminicultor quintus TaxID=1797291 RepID=A0A1F5A9R2_9BACT|nr:MAG: acetylornithine aminotransferase [Candidatus Atribacteria bacterium RBG_19FT_COMBO_35_14]